ncbi:hypothetical protein MKS88_002603 [Plasmodium brasilianum]|uniref:Uncharacterized protein n=1 Tax=Plasmodium brasilianum TaxID=5824 RepID=A0ACB9YC83_PLABR|nr:hypothetical protein MKS88_002603 [Plasmodium brasilianum]
MIYFNILLKDASLYNLDEVFIRIIPKEDKTLIRNCVHFNKYYEFHIKHYNKCEGHVNNEFSKELSNIKKVYYEKISDVTECLGRPKISSTKNIYAFASNLTTIVVLLRSLTLLFIYKVNKNYS